MPDWFPEAMMAIVCLAAGVLAGYLCAWAWRRGARANAQQTGAVPGRARDAAVCLFDEGMTVPATVREDEETFVEAMADAVILADADGVIGYASPAAIALGLDDDGRLASDDLRDLLALTAVDGETRSRELTIAVADLPHASAAAVAAAASASSGRGIKAGDDAPSDMLYLKVRVARLGEGRHVVFLRDISEQRRFEAMRRDFVTNVSHELKTPAGAISLLAETVGDAADDPEAVKYFSGRIIKESTRLTELVHRLIDLQKAQSQSAAHTAERLDALDVAREALADNRVQAEAKRIALILSLDGKTVDLDAEGADVAKGDANAETMRDDAIGTTGASVMSGHEDTTSMTSTGSVATPAVEVMGDRDSLVTAVKNLVENAIHYSPEGTTVRVAVATQGQAVTIRVVDQGIGIPRESLGRIFERFYRVDPARSRATGGTGLGLSIVKHCVEECSGTIRVWSKPNEGSTFTIELPVAPSATPVIPDDPAPSVIPDEPAPSVIPSESATSVILSEGEAEVEESPSATPSTTQGAL